MPQIQRYGLLEALEDFGIDTRLVGVDASMLAVPVIELQSLGFNYEPSLRARLLCTINEPAGGAGLTSGATIKTQPAGLWLRGVGYLAASSSVIVSVTNVPWIAAGAAVAWNAVGSSPGQFNGPSTTAADLFIVSAFQGSQVAAPFGGFTIDARNVCFAPLWIPGNAYLNLCMTAPNVALGVTLDCVVPASSPGKWA